MAEPNSLQFLILSSETIKNAYLKQCDKELSRLLMLEPEFDWKIVTRVDLSFLNVVHICNFTLVTNLEYLKLTQNKIQKIENLDMLVKLRTLDLSYNKISKIENLEKLTALTFISLAGNNISKLENLDAISQLQTLFINDNAITDTNELFYLTRFKYLQVLDTLNNPATKCFTLADLEASMQLRNVKFPSLRYFNTKRLSDFTVHLPVNESEHSLAQLPDDRNKKRQEILNDAIGKQLIYNMFKDRGVSQILSKLNRETKNAFLTCKKQMTNHMNTLYNICLKR